jgi:hypothetical protein
MGLVISLHRGGVFASVNLADLAKSILKGQKIKYNITESTTRASSVCPKVEAADDPSDGAGEA